MNPGEFRIAYSADFCDDQRRPVFPDIGLSLLDGVPRLAHEFLQEYRPEYSPDQLAGYDVLVSLKPKITALSLQGISRLCAIGRCGVGYDNVDLDACTEHGIAVFITPGGVVRPVAESIILLLLASSHNLLWKDRLVRQGRAFGIHVLLGSQTLGGAYTVARTTLGQMVIRIALQCNEADAYLIMDENNPAPRLLSRPGEGIYNDMAGALEGNSPFQVVWLPEEVRDQYLSKVRSRADESDKSYPGPIVFEGNIPADVRENQLLRDLLEAEAMKRAPVGRVWLGAPNSIKGPTEAAFRRQSGNNLLMVGQNDESILALFSIALISLAAQYRPGAAEFILCDATAPGTPASDYLAKVVQAIPHTITLSRPGDLPELLKRLSEEAAKRAEQPDPDAAPPVFLLIHGLQKFSRLRYEEEFGFSSGSGQTEVSPGSVLNDLVCERTRLGFHVIASCDTYNNVNRFLSRKALSEFEMRVLFQMSANDSASLIDTPKAGMLGLHRALFFNAQEGYLETFRPYALPDPQWVEEAGRRLRKLLSEPVDSKVVS